MKILFLSDIHGSIHYLEKGIDIYEKENAQYIVILGDALYHGPRNPLPKDYNPKEVASLLNKYKDKIVAVRGNCDSEVDQMMLEYPIMADYGVLFYNGKRIYITHGHIYNKDNLPNICEGDILAYGHTHVPLAEKYNGIYVLNPGSITLPKENNPNSYGILENNLFEVKDLEGNILKSIKIS
ncbi:phosphodiesterase YfcE [Gottschalkia acidurici 9a]|uniref:Phosphoesterase n=1 Tax=Gottschalkia acidurici (strain ATCC 7906 / DSM 604 / BCRC 14475 / CIP 104303 / KCTC 5404 / NCIMB 10678 / 9a) TaxID=1128398 RepID=K0B2R4_GOTA9|nr:phosphodiesterase [Gottschalkia acidurici]AFS79407.1 phosphodiesterase YfcE [Gottschalkia acidurici 9a]